MTRIIFVLLGIAVAVYAQGRIGKWWTNGAFVIGSQEFWEWGTTGIQFNKGDNRWASNPVDEPDGEPVRWVNERVSLSVVNNGLNSDQLTSPNYVICE
ncbi:hypothetical protein B566_EDAN002696 [Ephemera danica]|nr:hypothetical protein B566_EDAN002696 [Ephemera danica]